MKILKETFVERIRNRFAAPHAVKIIADLQRASFREDVAYMAAKEASELVAHYRREARTAIRCYRLWQHRKTVRALFEPARDQEGRLPTPAPRPPSISMSCATTATSSTSRSPITRRRPTTPDRSPLPPWSGPSLSPGADRTTRDVGGSPPPPNTQTLICTIAQMRTASGADLRACWLAPLRSYRHARLRVHGLAQFEDSVAAQNVAH